MEAAAVPTAPRGAHSSWRRYLGFGLPWAVVLGIVGYAVGHWIGTRIGNHVRGQMVTDQDDVAIFMGLLFCIVGWCAGLGFFAYPLRRMMGHPPSLEEREGEGEGTWR